MMFRLSALAVLLTSTVTEAQEQRTNMAFPSDFLQLNPDTLVEFDKQRSEKVTDIALCSDATTQKLQYMILSYSDGTNEKVGQATN